MKIKNLKVLFMAALALLPIFTLTNSLSAQEIWVKLLRHGAVNQIKLEEYVCGVLAGEISPSWPLEALKAMAVCARTFAANKVMANFNNYYHITSEVRDQVYRNGFGQNESFARAVTETQGEVLTYAEDLAQVYYCASSGGYTASCASVWGNDFPYLKALADPYSTEDPYNSWTLILNPNEFLRALHLSGTLKNVEVIKRDESSRVQELKISVQGRDYVKAGKILRDALGSNQLRSTFFEVRMENGRVVFTGNGWGHGVGLSQWGAKKMAEQGYTYDQILKFYFPGTIMGEVVASP
ncbi:MAG: SpoIID/LytB domain-containing protein [Candidatus Omnitrophica bacterium]|nr:SpoIID/LytB domain-containing protein [Candidatus Omnitrophota bacterium]